MEYVVLTSRLLLAVVFLVAGLSKLADRPGAQQALLDFGIPAVLASPLSILLPIAELLTAACLVPVASAWWGATLALALLLTFFVAIGVALARGKTPNCHCFGRLHSTPIGWATLVRCGTLAVVAAFVVATGHSYIQMSAMIWFEALSRAEYFIVVGGLCFTSIVVIEGWVLLHLMRQNGRLLLRMDALDDQLGVRSSRYSESASSAGLAVGDWAPAFRLADLSGKTVTLDALFGAGNLVLLVFWNPNCGPCKRLLPQIARWQSDHTAVVTIALISEGTVPANRLGTSTSGVERVLLQKTREVSQAYQIRATPSAVLVRPNGQIASPVVSGLEPIQALVEQLVDSLVTLSEPTSSPQILLPANTK